MGLGLAKRRCEGRAHHKESRSTYIEALRDGPREPRAQGALFTIMDSNPIT